MAKTKKIDAAKSEPAKLLHRVIHARLPENLRPACEAIARQARDLNNTSVWIARQSFECFAWDAAAKQSKLKAASELPQDGLLALAAWGKAIGAQNAKRTAKAKAALQAYDIEKAKADRKRAANKAKSAQPNNEESETHSKTTKEAQPQNIDNKHANPMAETFSAPRGASASQRNWLSRAEPCDASGPGRHRRKRVHEDAQAALNAIRKCSPGFCCTSKVSLGHAIWIYVRGSWRELHTQPKHLPEKQSSFLGRTIGPPRIRNQRRASKPEPTF